MALGMIKQYNHQKTAKKKSLYYFAIFKYFYYTKSKTLTKSLKNNPTDDIEGPTTFMM